MTVEIKLISSGEINCALCFVCWGKSWTWNILDLLCDLCYDLVKNTIVAWEILWNVVVGYVHSLSKPVLFSSWLRLMFTVAVTTNFRYQENRSSVWIPLRFSAFNRRLNRHRVLLHWNDHLSSEDMHQCALTADWREMVLKVERGVPTKTKYRLLDDLDLRVQLKTWRLKRLLGYLVTLMVAERLSFEKCPTKIFR